MKLTNSAAAVIIVALILATVIFISERNGRRFDEAMQLIKMAPSAEFIFRTTNP